MPALFIGHGSPMLAVTENPYRTAWRRIGAALPRPRAILCISAHWVTDGTRVATKAQPQTIHDFGGFPRELYAQQYPAPGAPDLARRVMGHVTSTVVVPDDAWGLDHGAWCVLQSLFPAADVPVCQLSLDAGLSLQGHLQLGGELAALRDEGVLILGSGNVVHNLRRMRAGSDAYDWAVEFDAYVRRAVETGYDDALVDYMLAGESAALSVPTTEHYLPLLYVAGARQARDRSSFPVDGFDLGSLSMLSVAYGSQPIS